jgi:hypothetical protein
LMWLTREVQGRSGRTCGRPSSSWTRVMDTPGAATNPKHLCWQARTSFPSMAPPSLCRRRTGTGLGLDRTGRNWGPARLSPGRGLDLQSGPDPAGRAKLGPTSQAGPWAIPGRSLPLDVPAIQARPTSPAMRTPASPLDPLLPRPRPHLEGPQARCSPGLSTSNTPLDSSALAHHRPTPALPALPRLPLPLAKTLSGHPTACYELAVRSRLEYPAPRPQVPWSHRASLQCARINVAIRQFALACLGALRSVMWVFCVPRFAPRKAGWLGPVPAVSARRWRWCVVGG